MACGQVCQLRAHCNFAYSALACFRMGMSGSASFQRRNSGSLRKADAAQKVLEARVGAHGLPVPGDCEMA